MVAINTVKAGDVLYDCRRQKMGNTTMSQMATWEVRVKEIDTDHTRIFASWNGNAPKWMYRREVERLRRTPYKPRQTTV